MQFWISYIQLSAFSLWLHSFKISLARVPVEASIRPVHRLNLLKMAFHYATTVIGLQLLQRVSPIREVTGVPPSQLPSL